MGTVSFSREFLARLMLEVYPWKYIIKRYFLQDSCHYLLYSILFLTSHPVTMALLPISLFAALQFAAFLVSCFQMSFNFIQTKLMLSTGNNHPVCQKLNEVVRMHTPTCLGIIACAEIFLVPILISMIFV